MIEVISAIVGIFMTLLKYFLSPEYQAKREEGKLDDTIQKNRAAIDRGGSDLDAAMADQHDRVQRALRGRSR